MRCPICLEEGRRHTLTETRVPSTRKWTVRRYYDENDRIHVHDDEVRIFVYACSNGHNWKIEAMSRCPSRDCYWNEQYEVLAGQKGLTRDEPSEK